MFVFLYLTYHAENKADQELLGEKKNRLKINKIKAKSQVEISGFRKPCVFYS